MTNILSTKDRMEQANLVILNTKTH